MSGSRVVDAGTPPSGFDDWTTTVVRFHNFADLPTTNNNEGVISPQFTCFGHNWLLKIYPGGEEDSHEGYVAVYLANTLDKIIKIEYGYSVRDAAGKEVVYHKPSTDEFAAHGNGRNNSWRYPDFAEQSKIMKSLVNGALVIDVRMRLVDTNKSTPLFIPKNSLNDNIRNKFNDEESADVVFQVGRGAQQAKGKRKKAKTSTTNFYAHRFILQDISTTLAELCKPSDGGDSTPIKITDIEPGVFNHILYYMYGGKISDEELETNAKDIIDACDKYGIVNLKLGAEACYVKMTQFSVDNMIDNLLYADTKNLALLKEAIMDYIVANKNNIMGKVSFDNVPSSMITDVLAAVARVHQSEEDGDSESIKYNKMRVSELREKLDEKGLDVDGSREAMIAILKEQSPIMLC